MRLRWMHVQNVYGFRDCKLDFPETGPCVLAGVNGSGKSTLLDSIAMFLAPAVATLQGTQAHKALYGLNRNAIHIQADEAQAELNFASETKKHTWKLKATRKDAKWVDLPASRKWARELSQNLLEDKSLEAPVLCYYPAVRFYVHEGLTRKPAEPESFEIPQLYAYAYALEMGQRSFSSVVTWFRRREDVESERRRFDDSNYQDPYLETVRKAVIDFMNALSGDLFSTMRIRRPVDEPANSHMYITKEGLELPLFNLSDGERSCIALVADLAQRLAAANPPNSKTKSSPLQGRGVVLIDELELHLHPKWQRRILPALTKTFPQCQFIVTTHSPQVLSSVRYEQIRLLSGFQVDQRLIYTEGRDSNAILQELLDVPKRPEAAQNEIDQLAQWIDAERFDEARMKLRELEHRWGSTDEDLLRLSTILRVMED